LDIQTVSSQDLTLGALFTEFYVVPDFQREFVWEDDAVNQLLQDLFIEFRADNTSLESEYFLGSMVVCVGPGGVYELIDGQQRITTTFLIFCAIRDHLKGIKAPPLAELNHKISAYDIDREGKEIFRQRVSLLYEDSSGLMEAIGSENAKIDEISEDTRSIRNILNAYRFVRKFLQEQLGEDQDAIRSFYVYLTRNVKLSRVKTVSVGHALKVFETMNNRGVGLDTMDLLKNLMFMYTPPNKYHILRDKWKDIVDTLFNAGGRPLGQTYREERIFRFLNYFIVSNYRGYIRTQEDLYEWIVRHDYSCGYKEQPLEFVDSLIQALRSYRYAF